jgi:hypothetical protein
VPWKVHGNLQHDVLDQRQICLDHLIHFSRVDQIDRFAHIQLSPSQLDVTVGITKEGFGRLLYQLEKKIQKTSLRLSLRPSSGRPE